MTTETRTKHTPGPWALYFQHMSSPVIYQDGNPTGPAIARPERINNPQWEANVRLIAAAPELLEALLNAMAQLEWANIHGSRAENLLAKARAAIAKATGEQP